MMPRNDTSSRAMLTSSKTTTRKAGASSRGARNIVALDCLQRMTLSLSIAFNAWPSTSDLSHERKNETVAWPSTSGHSDLSLVASNG